jgi:hypothetical protein
MEAEPNNMDADSRDAPIPPERPFALLVAPDAPSSVEALETAFRHMGLRPEIVAAAGADTPCFRLHLGALQVLVGRAMAAQLALADPDDRATSRLGAVLPGGWREDCWFVCREDDAWAGGVPGASFEEFCRLLVLSIDLFAAQQLFWSPARLWSDAAQFRGAIAEMQVSGMPPVLHLVAFRRRDGGAGERVTTRGLVAFAGQELEAMMPPGWDMAAMVKRLARLALDMMLNGPLTRAQQAPGLHSGEWVVLTPQRGDGDRPATVRVEFSVDR